MADEKKSDIAKRVKAAIKAEEKKVETEKAEAKPEAEKAVTKPAEKKAEPKKESKKEEEKFEERVLMVPLRDAWLTPRTRRSRAAIKVLRRHVARHTKRAVVKIDGSVNELIFARGIRTPPRRIKVRARIMKDSTKVFTA